MKEEGVVHWIEDLCQEDNELVGKKCANLGELARIGVRVPPGFAISVGCMGEICRADRHSRDNEAAF